MPVENALLAEHHGLVEYRPVVEAQGHAALDPGDRVAPPICDHAAAGASRRREWLRLCAWHDQLIKTLRVEQTAQPLRSRKVSGPSGGGTPVRSEIGVTAARHGRELQRQGFTLEQVVHDYGDLCQAITEVAFEHAAPIEVDEFRTLNRCLDNAIADAVTEFAYQRDLAFADTRLQTFNERMGSFAHELRNLIHTATLVVATIKQGNVGFGGATGAVLDRSLMAMRNLVDRPLADVRAAGGLPLGGMERMFLPFAQFAADRSGLGLGLSICRRSVEANDGVLSVSDLPGVGCVFTIDLPRRSRP